MNRVAAAVGFVLVAIGLAVFGWKAFVYDLPVLPTDPEGLWRVELDVTVRGAGGRGSVRAPVPSTAPGQEVYDERSSADRLLFTLRTEDGGRTAVWRGAFDGVHDIAYGFRVRLARSRRRCRQEVGAPPPEIAQRYAGCGARVPDRRRRDRDDAADARAAAVERRRRPPPLDLRDGGARSGDDGGRLRRRAARARQSRRQRTWQDGAARDAAARGRRAGASRHRTRAADGRGATRDSVGRSLGGRRLGAALAHRRVLRDAPRVARRAARRLVRERRGDRRRKPSPITTKRCASTCAPKSWRR